MSYSISNEYDHMKLDMYVWRILAVLLVLSIGCTLSGIGVCDPNNIQVIKYASPGDVVYLSVSGLQPNGASTVEYYWTISEPSGTVVYSGATYSTYSPSIGWQVPDPFTPVGYYTVNVLMTPGGLSQTSACIESVCGKILFYQIGYSMRSDLQSETICNLDNTQRSYAYSGPTTGVNVNWYVDGSRVGSSNSETIDWSSYTLGDHNLKEDIVSTTSGVVLGSSAATITLVAKPTASGITAL